jgi:hypothetical protein
MYNIVVNAVSYFDRVTFWFNVCYNVHYAKFSVKMDRLHFKPLYTEPNYIVIQHLTNHALLPGRCNVQFSTGNHNREFFFQ